MMLIYTCIDNLKGFLHSHSYTGNPLCCAVALATLELFEEHDTIEQNKALSAFTAQAIKRFEDHPHVADVRQTGMIAAIEMVKDKEGPYALPLAGASGHAGLRVSYQEPGAASPAGKRGLLHAALRHLHGGNPAPL